MEVSASEARAEFRTLVDRAHYNGERIVVTKNGKPYAALVPISDVETLRAIEDAIDIEEARKALADPARFTHAEVMERLLARPDDGDDAGV